MPKLVFKLCNRMPGKNARVLPIVRRIGREAVGPTAAAHKRQQRPLVQPGQTNLGDRARPTTNDDAGIAGERHEQVARIAHARRNDNRGGPVGCWHDIRRDDADHQATGADGALGSHASCGAAAAADDRDPMAGEKRTCVPGEVERGRAGFSAAEHAYLGPADLRKRHDESSSRPDDGS
jgi:hypothetical protein